MSSMVSFLVMLTVDAVEALVKPRWLGFVLAASLCHWILAVRPAGGRASAGAN